LQQGRLFRQQYSWLEANEIPFTGTADVMLMMNIRRRQQAIKKTVSTFIFDILLRPLMPIGTLVDLTSCE
jgi:hypothetical protein